MMLIRTAFLIPIRAAFNTAVAGAMLLIGACATAPLPAVFDRSAFTAGEVELNCQSLGCANRWRSRQSSLEELYAAEDWESLANLVSDLQYGSDLAYFYLGRAAEGSEAYAGAKVYYARALNGASPCGDSVFNQCRGIDVPTRATQRMEALVELLTPPTMDLLEAQSRLSQLGLYTIKIDGISGPRTLAAIRQFQEDLGLEVSGELDVETIRALASTATSAELVSAATDEAIAEPAADETGIVIAEAETAVAEQIEEAQPRATEDIENPSPLLADSDRDPAADALPEVAAQASGQAAQERAEAAADLELAGITEPEATTELVAMAAAPAEGAMQADSQRVRVKVAVELLSDADPFADVVGVLQPGAWVTVVDWGDEWSIVSGGNSTGYIYTDILE